MTCERLEYPNLYFVGVKHDGVGHVRAVHGRGEADLPLFARVRNHSGELNWGYSGSGPAQLSLALACYTLKAARVGSACDWAQGFYQDFKRAVVCRLPGHWEMSARVVLDYYLTWRKFQSVVDAKLFWASSRERGLLCFPQGAPEGGKGN